MNKRPACITLEPLTPNAEVRLQDAYRTDYLYTVRGLYLDVPSC